MKYSGLKEKVVDIRGMGLEITKQLKPVMDMIPSMLFWKDLDGVYCGCNESLLNKFGFKSASEIIGKTDSELPWSSKADLFVKEDKELMENGGCMEKVQTEITSLNGERLTFAVIKTPLKSHTGEVIGIIGNCIDITHCEGR